MRILFLLLLITFNANADELGLRYNNVAFPDASLGSQNFGGGKLLEVKFDKDMSFSNNIYIEGAVGEYYANDFDQWTSTIVEASPGIQVRYEAVRFRVSQGLAYIPNASIPKIEFATHLNLSFIDKQSEVSVGIERTHYSNGSSTDPTNTGLDMTGITIGFKL